jgi:hypothetical protein
MPRFTNSLTGSVVNVDEATAAQLGAEYVPTEQPKAESEQKPKTRRTRSTN